MTNSHEANIFFSGYFVCLPIIGAASRDEWFYWCGGHEL